MKFLCPNCKSATLRRNPNDYDQGGNNCGCGYPSRNQISKSKCIFKKFKKWWNKIWKNYYKIVRKQPPMPPRYDDPFYNI